MKEYPAGVIPSSTENLQLLWL